MTAPSLREQFLALDDTLAREGVPPLTTWWRDGIGAWLDAYEAGDALELCACVGRGAAKSTALYKLALFFTLFGDFAVPIGERHYAVVLSRLVSEASKGIHIIARWMTLLGVRHRVAGDVIDLADLRRGIRVAAASVAGVSGWRAYFVGKDERSKWPSGGADENDAEEIDTSAAAMTATHARAAVVSVGSAWGDFGAFYDAVIGGTDATKHVLGPAPTWVAAPHITEESTHRKERDPRRHAREYGAVFGLGTMRAIDVEQFAACVREMPLSEPLGPCVGIMDSCGGKGDTFTITFWRWELEHVHRAVFDEHGHQVPQDELLPPVPRLVLVHMTSFEGPIAQRMTTHDVGDAIVTLARHFGARQIHGDQYGAWSWTSDLKKRGLQFVEHPWTNPTKTNAVLRLRQLVKEGTLVISPELGSEADALIGEVRTFDETLLPSGALSFGARGKHHDDRIMTVLLAARVDADGGLRGSPLQVRSGKTILDQYPYDEDYDAA